LPGVAVTRWLAPLLVALALALALALAACERIVDLTGGIDAGFLDGGSGIDPDAGPDRLDAPAERVLDAPAADASAQDAAQIDARVVIPDAAVGVNSQSGQAVALG
jgi:hypothetical protein